MPPAPPLPTRCFARLGDSFPLPDLTRWHRRAYERLFAPGHGFDAVFREMFPIRAHEGDAVLHYERLELGEPEHDLETCRRHGRSHTRPLFAWLRLEAKERVSERLELARVPILLGGGEYLINGNERVVIGQLVRAPGIDFFDGGCRIRPEFGGKVDLAVGRRGTLEATLSVSATLPALTLLRALSPDFSADLAICQRLHPVRTTAVDASLLGAIVAEDIVHPRTGEVLLDAGGRLTETGVEQLRAASIVDIATLVGEPDALLLDSLTEEQPRTHEQAMLAVARLLSKGLPANLDRARQVLRERFADSTRFRVGRAGRARIERKLGGRCGTDALSGDDVARAIRYLLDLRSGKGEIDDIDHLGNRRVRLVDELLAEAVRKGLHKLRRVVQDRMRKNEKQSLRPADLVSVKAVSSAVDHFFARSEFSQLADRSNPLAQLAHLRRLTAVGPGGVDRKRARFDIRDVHVSHLGRLCPVETPEGEAIGLTAHLALYADVDECGFLVTPSRVVSGGKLDAEVGLLRADEEDALALAPADVLRGPNAPGTALPDDQVMARRQGDFTPVAVADVRRIAVSPKQMVGVSAGLIPFLEHDDANRALMGSNMQRQAVPLLITEPPIVATGLEREAARQSSLVVCAEQGGRVEFVDARRIVVGKREYRLRRFAPAAGACFDQKPLVAVGQRVKAGDVIADGPATSGGELALGRNLLAAFMTWGGYNYEDAILISERLVRDDTFTSLHLEEFTCDLRDNRHGDELFTPRVPGVPRRVLSRLNEDGIVRVGARVIGGDVLVGKTVPRTRPEQTAEMRILQSLLGRGEERDNDSLEVPPGVEGVVIDVRRDRGEALGAGLRERVTVTLASKRVISVGDKMAGRHGNKGVISKILRIEDMPHLADGTPVDILLNPLGVPSRMNVGQILETHLGWAASTLGFRAITPVFDGATEEAIRACLREAKLPASGKATLYDGRTGERFDQPVTVGILYMLKLHHLVDDKVHARATGPYSLITQQPLGGRSREGGQRFGEMEVWALEAYGAAATLREMLTLKSDDVEGRAKTYEALLAGTEPPPPGTPASVEVLRQELRGLGIELELEE